MAVLLADTAVLLHNSAVDTGTDCSVVSTGQREMAVLPGVTAVLLYQNAVDIWTDCNFVNTG